MDWTHEDISINDIRKIKGLYIISVDDKNIKTPMLVKEDIFDERLKSYFLKEPGNISRSEILGVRWNMYLQKGYFVKPTIISPGNIELTKFHKLPDRWYVSFMEIAGPLGSFDTIIQKN